MKIDHRPGLPRQRQALGHRRREHIAANGTEVRGAMATNGGDDPNTPEHENVSGALRVDPARVRHDFDREMRTVASPTVPVMLPPPPGSAAYPAGPEAAPTVYLVPGSLTQLRISAPADGSNAAIVIMINGAAHGTATRRHSS